MSLNKICYKISLGNVFNKPIAASVKIVLSHDLVHADM